jgi:hypothetical protein
MERHRYPGTPFAQTKAAADGEAMLRWLMTERGLTLETIIRHRLGYCPHDIFDDAESWGGSAGDQMTIRSGLIIPTMRYYLPAGHDVAINLKIRVERPSLDLKKYTYVRGGHSAPMILGDVETASTFVVCESELDGILIHQEAPPAPDLCLCTIALRSASNRPPAVLHNRLASAVLILIAHDNDPAGLSMARWWLNTYHQNAKQWPVPMELGKDPGEARKAGLSIRAWIEAGIMTHANLKNRELKNVH